MGVNLNTLVSQILRQYVTWGRYAHKLKFVPASKEMLRKLFDALPKDTAETIGRDLGKTIAREEILFFFQQVRSASVLRFIEMWGSHFNAFEHHYDGKKHFFTIHHDVNSNFSVFAKEYLSSMVQSTLARLPQFEAASPNSISFNFED